MASTNIINAVFGSGLCAVTTSAFRANYGMVLRFSGIDLPTAFECDFSNYDVAGRDSVTAIGQNGEVQIPDDLWDSGLNIYAFVYLHPTDDSGVTVYTVTIPVLGRPNRTDETPTPHEQTVIEQAISALNDAVEQTAADVASADASAIAAAQSEANASVSERAAAASASAALASQNAAESASRSATESASASAESAESAAASADSAYNDVERAERAAATATGKATEASASAATASTKATQAEQSATAAAQSASSASTAAQNAAESEQLAESHATDAEQAKQDAQDAQAAAEQAAESVSGLSAQIAQNTADIADLVLSKAGALIDTASGSIASFVPDATIPTVKGLTVEVEPVQDLHGYDNPWPAGGGKNLLDPTKIHVYGGAGSHYGIDVTYANGVFTFSGTATTSSSGASFNFAEYDDYSLSGRSLVVQYFDKTGTGTINNIYGLRTETENKIAITLNFSGSQTVNFSIKLSVAETSQTSWTPYSNICPISGWDEVEVQRTGKNLLKLDESEMVSTGWNRRFPISLKAGTYIISCQNQFGASTKGASVNLTDENDATIIKALTSGYTFGDTTFVGTAATITEEEAKKIKNIRFALRAGGTTYNDIAQGDIQLELGSTATAYEPYQGDTYTIPLGQTVYGCKIYATAGKMVVDSIKDTVTVVNGAIRSSLFQESTGHAVAVLGDNVRIDLNRISQSSNMNTVSSTYPLKMANLCQHYFAYASDTSHWYVNNQLYLYLPKADVGETVASYRDYLASNPFEVIIPLATPITVDLTPIEISVLTGQTNNIWADTGDVSVEYAADLKTYIDKKIAAAVAALS